jgi:hypothetical protein
VQSAQEKGSLKMDNPRICFYQWDASLEAYRWWESSTEVDKKLSVEELWDWMSQARKNGFRVEEKEGAR